MTATQHTIVAIDGPSGSGKSTVARAAAQRLGWHLLDTGSVYRALAWFGLRRGVDLADQPAVVALLPEFFDVWELSVEPDERWVRVDGVDVTDAIRDTAISEVVSKVATNLAVREAVNVRFRELLHGDSAEGIIAEGRDITTVVAPDAPVRILLTADEATRIARRVAEKTDDDAAAVAATVAERDARDSTVADFTTAADGVVTLDTSALRLDESIEAVLNLIRERGMSRKGSAE